MLGRSSFIPVLALLLTVEACASPSPSRVQERNLKLNGAVMSRCVLPHEVQARCGVLAVPEDPSNQGGRKIGLQVDVLPAKSTTASTPVFFLAGGPGTSAIQAWGVAASMFPGLDDHHDIVLVDQRGVGASHQMEWPSMASGEKSSDYFARALAAVDGDPRFYTTAIAMDDIDAVRAAMGCAKIEIYGGSYGATAAQYYIRQHGVRVAAVVLDGATALNVPVFEYFPSSSQHALDDVLARCLSDSPCHGAFPNVRSEFAEVMARLSRSPATTDLIDPATGQPVVVTADSFANFIHTQLLSESLASSVPWLIHRAWMGSLFEVAQNSLRGSGGGLVMATIIRCSEAWARYDPAELSRLGNGSYLVGYQLADARAWAAGCVFVPKGIVPANDAAPVRTVLPILLLSGEDDPQDPPSNMAGYQEQMPNGLLVVAPRQGHTVGHIGCFRSVVVAFFDTAKPDPATAAACAASLSPVPFKLA